MTNEEKWFELYKAVACRPYLSDDSVVRTTDRLMKLYLNKIAKVEEPKCARCDNPAAPEDTLCESCSDKVDLVCYLNDGYVETGE